MAKLARQARSEAPSIIKWSESSAQQFSIRVVSGSYTNDQKLDAIRRGKDEDFTAKDTIDGTAFRATLQIPAAPLKDRIAESIESPVGASSADELKQILNKVTAVAPEDVRSLQIAFSRYVAGMASNGIDPTNQPTSGAGLTVSCTTWRKPPFGLQRDNASVVDDHNLVEVRRAAGYQVQEARAPMAVFFQDRHPRGAVGSDVLWACRNYIKAQMLGLAQHEMLGGPAYQRALRDETGSSASAMVEQELWGRGRAAFQNYTTLALSMPGTILGVAADSAHPLFKFFASLGFFTFAPLGLHQEVERLPMQVPAEPSVAQSPLEEALKSLVGDMRLYVSEEYTKFWETIVQNASSFSLECP